MAMRRARFIGTALGCLFSTSVAAELVTYEYTGTVTSVSGPEFSQYEVGDQISGQIDIDTESGFRDEVSTPAYNGFFDMNLSATLGDIRYDTTTGELIFVDDPELDRFSFYSGRLEQGGWRFSLDARYTANPGGPWLGQDGVAPGSGNLVFTIIGDLALIDPESFFFQEGSPAETSVIWSDSGGENQLEATWDSFAPVPVPVSIEAKRSFVLRFISVLRKD